MATNGGKRPGAGRRKGGKNRATLEREAAVAASGATPLDVLIQAMRSFLVLADRYANNPKKFEHYTRAAADMAQRVAPLVHPRVTAPTSRPVFKLPVLMTAADIVQAQAAIAAAMSSGELSPAEATDVANVVELQRKAIETAVIETRLVQLENRMGTTDERL